jgi:hypothetical protein
MLIGISGHSQSGKDTIGRIIQHLTSNIKNTDFKRYCEIQENNELVYKEALHTSWQIKKFANPLKDIVCILTGCTRKQLEDIDFKNSKLPNEWIKYGYANGHIKSYIEGKESTTMNHKQCSKEVYEYEKGVNWQTAYKHHATYREVLQYIGTDLLRNQLHEDTWINATMLPYDNDSLLHDIPNWIITDVRFPNEYKAVKDRGGIMIRVNRSYVNRAEVLFDFGDTLLGKNTTSKLINLDHSEPHQSETALDNYGFDYIIDNNSDIDSLIDKVKSILQKEKLI